MATALVIENDPTDDLRRLGEWLTEAGLDLSVVRPHAGDAAARRPGRLRRAGGARRRPAGVPAARRQPGRALVPALEGLLRKAVRHRVPTLAICLGAQLLATAHGGTVERSAAGPEIGPGLVGRRDAADGDPLFGGCR